MADTFKGIITADGKKRQLPYENVLKTPVSDETLSIQGAFADAKAAGDKFKEAKAETASLKEDIDEINKDKLPVLGFEKVESKNLLDVSKFIEKGFLLKGEDGWNGRVSPGSESGFFHSNEFIKVLPNTTYIFSLYGTYSPTTVITSITYGDANKKYISGEYNVVKITTPDNCYFIRVSFNKDYINSKMMLEKGDTVTKYQAYFEPYYTNKYRHYLDFENFYIDRNVCTSNGNYISDDAVSAKYAQVDLGSNITKVMCKFKHHNGNAALIVMVNNTDKNIINVGIASIHVVFTPSKVNIGLYINHVLYNFDSVEYSTALIEGKEYEVGYLIGDNSLTIYLPDGTTHKCSDARINSCIGRYFCFETYSSNVSESHYKYVDFTSVFASCVSGNTFRDNFRRENGILTTSPSGHTYKLYRNKCASDTRYDNSFGTVN